jgi:flagellar basal-body rod protein FlgF
VEAGLYVALSGQLALQRRLDTIAHNVANSTTAGFRAENVTFDTFLSQSGGVPVAYATRPEPSFSPKTGGFTHTGNQFDIGIQGDALFAFASPAGTVYSRDGRLRLSAEGELESMGGMKLLDNGGAPIQINAGRGEVVIARNGVVTQNGQPVGTIGLYRLPPDAKLTRHEGAAFVSNIPAEPVEDFSETGMQQGYVESANVNSVLEITRLISVSRAFEALASSIDRADRQLSESIKTLGSGR